MRKNKHWAFGDIPDQSGRTAIVTGANTGIGFETARALAARNAHVVLAVRSMEKGEAARDRILVNLPDASVTVMRLDLSSLASVGEFATSFSHHHDRLALLINSAGVMVPPFKKTADGFELQFGVNHLGHFALTCLLLPLINRTTMARIVMVSSEAHRRGKVNFENLNGEKSYSKWPFYAQSKLANLLFTYELQRRLDAAGHTTLVLAAHPGWTATDLQRHTGLVEFFNRFFAMSPEQGALPTLFAATAPNLSGGTFFGPDGFMGMRGYPTEVRSNERSYDPLMAARLWDVSEELTRVDVSAAAAATAAPSK